MRQQEHRGAYLAQDCRGDFSLLVERAVRKDVLLGVLALPPAGIDLERLRAYLQANAEAFEDAATTTAWAKAVCRYDYLRFHEVDGGATNDA